MSPYSSLGSQPLVDELLICLEAYRVDCTKCRINLVTLISIVKALKMQWNIKNSFPNCYQWSTSASWLVDGSLMDSIEPLTMLYSKSLTFFWGYTLNLNISFQYCELVLMGHFCLVVQLFANVINMVKGFILMVNLLRLRIAMGTTNLWECLWGIIFIRLRKKDPP